MDIRKMIVLGILGSTPNYRKILNLFGSSLIGAWPLDETSGTTAKDVSGNLRNGTFSGATLNAGVTNINKPCPAFYGAASFVDIYSTSFASAFNGKEGSLFVSLAVSTAVYADGVNRFIITVYPNNDNNIYIYKSSSIIRFTYKAGATSTVINVPTVKNNWFRVAYTWSLTGDYVKSYLNGRYVTQSTGVGTWADPALLNTTTILGALSTSSNSGNHSGLMSDAYFLNRPATAAEILADYKLFTPGLKNVSILGDSISINDMDNWAEMVVGSWNSGKTLLHNHAVAGKGVIDGMDAQVMAAASDNASVIIIELGRNDNNAGNMTALQAEYEENLIELKASNPTASIFAMNVLPCWTDVGGGTEVDMSNVRTAIALACTAQSVTCWDTHTTPWITAAQTSDGTHPIAAGHAAIAAEVLARL